MGYITEARARANRRRSPWNLLLIPCYVIPWFLLVFSSVVVLGKLSAELHAVTALQVIPDTVGGILIALGALSAWLGPSMIVANQLVAVVPPARRALDREAGTVPGTDRSSANRRLLKLSSVLVPAGLLLALVGVVIPW
jgi:hypothetical protein